MEIESLIEASIDRVQERLAEEESLWENAVFLREQEGNGKMPMFIFNSIDQQEGLEPRPVSTAKEWRELL